MVRQPLIATPTYTLFPYTTFFRAPAVMAGCEKSGRSVRARLQSFGPRRSWSPRPQNTPGERSYRSSRADWQRPKRKRENPTDRTHKDGYRHWAMPRWRSHRGVAPLAHRRNENAPVWRNARTKSGRGKPSAILSAHNNGKTGRASCRERVGQDG